MARSHVRRMAERVDDSISGVFPDSHHIHARNVIFEEGLTEKRETFALKLSRRLLKKGKRESGEAAGKVAVKLARDKID